MHTIPRDLQKWFFTTCNWPTGWIVIDKKITNTEFDTIWWFFSCNYNSLTFSGWGPYTLVRPEVREDIKNDTHLSFGWLDTKLLTLELWKLILGHGTVDTLWKCRRFEMMNKQTFLWSEEVLPSHDIQLQLTGKRSGFQVFLLLMPFKLLPCCCPVDLWSFRGKKKFVLKVSTCVWCWW